MADEDAMALTSSDWKGRSFNISVSRIIAPPIKFYAGRACLRSDHALTPTLPLVMLSGSNRGQAAIKEAAQPQGGPRTKSQLPGFLRAAMIISGAPSDLGYFRQLKLLLYLDRRLCLWHTAD